MKIDPEEGEGADDRLATAPSTVPPSIFDLNDPEEGEGHSLAETAIRVSPWSALRPESVVYWMCYSEI